MSDSLTRPEECLDLETQAAFLDGRLDESTRAAVESHLATCPRCYEVFGEAAQLNADLEGTEEEAPATPLVHRAWPVRGVFAGLAAASILVITGGAWMLTRQGNDIEDRIATVVNGTTAERFSRGRLSAARAWAPAPSPVRGGSAGDLPLDVQQAAIGLQQMAVSDRTAASLRGAGIGLLALGRVDEAISRLQEAVALNDQDAAAHSDLSAALLDRAVTSGEAYDAVVALDHAERAILLAPGSAAALFNRALAHEIIGNRPQAAIAWREYLAIDGDGPWADEARAHLTALETTSAMTRPAVPELLASDVGRLTDLASRDPVALDRVLMRVVLRDWSQAPDRTDTGPLLRMSRALGAAGAHSPATRLADAALESRSWPAVRRQCLARGVTAFVQWQASVEAGRRETALRAAAETAQSLACSGLEPVLVALPSAWAALSLQRFEQAEALAAAAADEAQRAGYWALEAQLCELLSAIAIQDTRLSDATAHRVRGRRAAENARDSEALARFDELFGESADEQGDRSAAWTHFRRALEVLDAASSPLQRYGTLSTVTIAAGNAKLTGAASSFALQLIDAAEATGRATYRIMALLQHGRARAALEDIESGVADLLEAERLLDAMPEGHSKDAWRAEVGWVTGLIKASTDPAAAARGLSEAIDYFDRAGRRFRLAELLLHRGRIHRAQGDRLAALADFTRGAEVLEDQRPAIREEQLRISRAADVWDLFWELVHVHASDPEASLQVFERAKARELLEAVAPDRQQHALTVAELKACLPPGTDAIVYGAQPDSLQMWHVTREQVTSQTIPVTRRQLEKLVTDHQRDLIEGRDGGSAKALSGYLLPAGLSLDPTTSLVIVPDGPLEHLPFAALPTDRGYLVQTATPLLAPSLTTFCLRSRSSGRAPRSALLVGIAEPIPQSALPHLPDVPREIAEIATLYPAREVLLGASATTEAVSRSWGRHGILHFAGHAMVNERHPLESRLFTYPGAAPASLRFSDISSARLQPGSVVVLAACRTATGRVFEGEGTMSLTRPFLAAGAVAILGTLWDIRDADAGRVVHRVHTRLAAGERLDHALAETQRELIANKAAASVWSGYIVTGGIPARSHHEER